MMLSYGLMIVLSITLPPFGLLGLVLIFFVVARRY